MKIILKLLHGRLFCAAALGMGVSSNVAAAAQDAPAFNDANWISMGGFPGANGRVYAAVVDGSGNLYIGGEFTAVGDVLANHIAKWNGTRWSALSSGVDGSVSALAVSGRDIYAGGDFTMAGGSAAGSIAKWNGNSWSALGSGMSGVDSHYVLALAVSRGDVFAAGRFTTAGGKVANDIAKWNGSSWSALGSGMNDEVDALAVSGNEVYAGGYFTTAGGNVANYIAKWNGSSWSALGSGVDGSVYALAVSDSNLYVGGSFTTVGGVEANYIAKWNGSSWSALGSGVELIAEDPKDFHGIVSTLAVSGSDLYVGGSFKTAGGGEANSIAKWNGISWSALGSGVEGSVSALAVSGSDLYAGGPFTTAGGKVSAYIARAYLLSLPALLVHRSGTDVMVSWPSADTAGFALEQAGALATAANWVMNTAAVTDEGTQKSVTIPATNGAHFFRLRRP